jgi:defect-in-organelle-trafficking protein DotD
MIARRTVPANVALFGLCLGMSLLDGCANTIPVPTTVAAPGMPNPERALRQSMQHVDAEMAELGRLTPPVAAASPSTQGAASLADPVMPADLQRVVSFDWNGPLDQGVARLAASIGYTFYVTAPTSDPPLPVSVRMSSVPVYQVFHALGAEAGMRATVEVDPLHHQVLVIHHG